MRVIVNGQQKEIAAGISLTQLLAELRIDEATVAVEYNGQIVPRQAFAATVLKPSDHLEVVRFVAGG